MQDQREARSQGGAATAQEAPTSAEAHVTGLRSGALVGRDRELDWLGEGFQRATGPLDWTLDPRAFDRRARFASARAPRVREGERRRGGDRRAKPEVGRPAAHPPALLVLLRGESGSGKTRLLDELRSRWEREGALVLSGTCRRQQARAYEPFVSALRGGWPGALEEPGHDHAWAVRRLLGDDPAPANDDGLERQRLVDALAQALIARARRRPLVLTIDDLQWARGETLELLVHVYRALIATLAPLAEGAVEPDARPRPRLLIVGTYRPDELHGPELGRLLSELRHDRFFEQLTLGPLGSDDVGELIRSILCVDAAPRSFVERVTAASGGSPLFVELLLEELFERGAIARPPAPGPAAMIDGVELPARLSELVTARLARLPERPLVEWLAVLDRAAPPALLARLSGRPAAEVRAALEALRARRLVTGAPDGSFALAHPALRDAALQEAADRPARHAAAAEVLLAARSADGEGVVDLGAEPGADARMGAGANVSAAEVAHHLLEAGAGLKAARWARRAADEAAALGATERACELLARALVALDEQRALLAPEAPALALDRERLSSSRALGRALQGLARWGEARAITLRALGLAQVLGDARAEVSALAQLGWINARLKERDDARRCYVEALKRAERLEYGELAGESLRGLGHLTLEEGRLDEAVELLERSLAFARDLGDAREVASTLRGLAQAFRRRGRREDAQEHAELALEQARRSGDRASQVASLEQLGDLCFLGAEYERAVELAEQALSLATAIQDQAAVARRWLALGAAQERRGREHEAQAALEQAVRLARRKGLSVELAEALSALGAVRERQGRSEEALTCADEATTLWNTLGDRRRYAGGLRQLGRAFLRRGALARAGRCYEAALRVAGELPGRGPDGERGRQEELLASLGRAVVLHEVGQVDASRALLDGVALRAREQRDARVECLALLELGRLLADDGEPARGARALRRAATLASELGAMVQGGSEPSARDQSASEPSAREPSPSDQSASEPSARAPSASEPSASEPSASEPSASEPSAREPSASEPSASEPSAREPSAREQGAREQGAREQGAREQGAREPSAREPSAREPSAREPSAREPSASEQDAREPSASEQDAREPSASEQDAREPSAREQGACEPSAREQSACEQKARGRFDGAPDARELRALGARVALRVAEVDLTRGAPCAALGALRRRREWLRQAGDPLLDVEAELVYGRAALRVGDLAGAVSALEAALSSARARSAAALEAEALLGLGTFHRADAEVRAAAGVEREAALGRARSSLEAALELAARLGSWRVAVRARLELGRVAGREGDPGQAAQRVRALLADARGVVRQEALLFEAELGLEDDPSRSLTRARAVLGRTPLLRLGRAAVEADAARRMGLELEARAAREEVERALDELAQGLDVQDREGLLERTGPGLRVQALRSGRAIGCGPRADGLTQPLAGSAAVASPAGAGVGAREGGLHLDRARAGLRALSALSALRGADLLPSLLERAVALFGAERALLVDVRPDGEQAVVAVVAAGRAAGREQVGVEPLSSLRLATAAARGGEPRVLTGSRLGEERSPTERALALPLRPTREDGTTTVLVVEGVRSSWRSVAAPEGMLDTRRSVTGGAAADPGGATLEAAEQAACEASAEAAAVGEAAAEGTLDAAADPAGDPLGSALIGALAAAAGAALERARLAEELAQLKLGLQDQVSQAARREADLEARARAQATLLEGVRAELALREAELGRRVEATGLVGGSEPMLRVFRLLDKLRASDVPVLVTGEDGTGKELVARTIHAQSRRRERPFLTLDVASLPERLLEVELFGAGDADPAQTPGGPWTGQLVAADGGTLFLAGVGELPPALQGKLLRALEEGAVRPVGGGPPRPIDVRVVSATCADLRERVDQGLFRADLFYRLNGVALALPPLRERLDDLPLLVEHLLERAAVRSGAPRKTLDRSALEALARHDWPGNVRELEAELRRLAARSGPRIVRPDLPAHLRRPAGEASGADDEAPLKARMERIERRLLVEALRRHDQNKTRTAKALGLSRFGFLKKLDKYGLRDDD